MAKSKKNQKIKKMVNSDQYITLNYQEDPTKKSILEVEGVYFYDNGRGGVGTHVDFSKVGWDDMDVVMDFLKRAQQKK